VLERQLNLFVVFLRSPRSTNSLSLNTTVVTPARELCEATKRHKRQKKDNAAPHRLIEELDAEEDAAEERPVEDWKLQPG